MKVKIKKLVKEAVIPSYAKPGDAGLDLTAISKSYDENGNIVYGTGLALELEEGYVCYLFPRSSNSKKDLLLTNSVGVLDSGYRGEIFFKFAPFRAQSIFKRSMVSNKGTSKIQKYEIGDRVGQMVIMPYPIIELEEVEELSESHRGENGYGSSGR